MKRAEIFVYSILILILSFIMIPNLANDIRYKVESTIWNVNTIAGDPVVGIMEEGVIPIDDFDDGYTDRIDMTDKAIPYATVKISKYNKPKIYLIVDIYNNNEKVYAFINDSPVDNITVNEDYRHDNFWNKIYISKTVIVEIPPSLGKKQIIITAGRSNKTYKVNINK